VKEFTSGRTSRAHRAGRRSPTTPSTGRRRREGHAAGLARRPCASGRKILRHRSSREVSVAYFWVLLVGFALWIAYGVVIDNWFLIVPNAVALTVSAATIAVAPRFQPRIQQG
jgi:MtN3 and saliva related transmembrane protein